jgi:hypothetical protein
MMGARSIDRFLAGAVALALVAIFSLHTAPARAARTFTRALTDDVWFDAGWQSWIPRTTATGAKIVLLEVDWTSVAPKAPMGGVNPSSPSDPQYDFSYLDQIVREFAGTGISPAFLVSDAPQWAEAPGGPSLFEQDGAWEPNATAFGQFATALASRYSGSYPDPANPGRTLPRVRYFQAWGEANFSIHLAPQWTRGPTGWVATGPSIYRNLLNAFYAGVKSVHSNNFVITTGFGPYGDPAGACTNQEVGAGCRMPPAMFARELMCLHGEGLQPQSCPNPAHFDALAMDPYEVGSPATHAFNIDDVSAPDLGKLTRVVHKAVRLGRALPRGNKQLWVTEFSYDSNPPNPTAVSLATQARWLEQGLYIFYKQGVNTAVWYLIHDQLPTYNPTKYYSGLYFYNGAPKPALEAYRFPLVVMPAGRKATVWGISPRSGKVQVEHQVGRRWRSLFSTRQAAGSVFSRTISASLRGNFRAVVGGEKSLTWRR